MGSVPVVGGTKKTLPAAAKEDILYPVRKDGRDEAALEIRLADSLPAPVEAGAAAGEAVLTVNGERVRTVSLIVREGTASLTFGRFFQEVIEAYIVS